MAGSVIILVLCVGMGIVYIWDVGDLASKMRSRLEAMPVMGASYKWLPSWAFRAFGVWCILFGIGQLIYVYATVHHSSH